MQKESVKFWDIFKRALYSITFAAVSCFYTLINRYTGRERELVTALDNLIHFNSYFVLVYVFWYVYMGVFLVYFCLFDGSKYFKLLICINLGMIVSYFIYIIFPTTVPRPVFNPENDVVGGVFRWLYSNDSPYNCFPSIHVLNTFLVALYVQRDEKINNAVKTLSWICATSIVYSTFAIKQHVILDAVSAIGIALMLQWRIDTWEAYAWQRNRENVRDAG